jgi:hypothetical protein
MDMDTDLAAPVLVAPDTRNLRAAGTAPVHAPVEVAAPVATPVAAPVPAGPVVRPSAPSCPVVETPALLPRAVPEAELADNQLYAAAELVRRGLAVRVTITNAAVDSALPDEWLIRGTPIHLERHPDGRATVTVGGSAA